MIKKILCLNLIALALLSCEGGPPKKLEVEGNVKNAGASMLYLEEISFNGNQPLIIDSGKVEADGSFKLEAVTSEEGLYSIRPAGNLFPIALLINDAANIEVEADPQNVEEPFRVSGSKATRRLLEYEQESNQRARKIYEMSVALDSVAKKRIEDSTATRKYRQIEKQVADLKEYTLEFIEKSKSPVLVLYVLNSYQTMMNNLGLKRLNDTEVTEILQDAAAKFPKSKAIAAAQEQLRPSKAPDFTLPDINGNNVSLSSFKGKYVLVDFWASWCQPCRKENPNVVKTYQEFKDKNFTILGVSLDQKREAWIEAVKEDNLTWTHVSDLQYWNSKVVDLFGFNSIPYNILVDPEGNIIAEDLHGEALREKLRQVLK